MTLRGIKGKISNFMTSESFTQIFHCIIKSLSMTSCPSLCIKVVCPHSPCLRSSHTSDNACSYRRQGKFSHHKNKHNSYFLFHFQKAQTHFWRAQSHLPTSRPQQSSCETIQPNELIQSWTSCIPEHSDWQSSAKQHSC